MQYHVDQKKFKQRLLERGFRNLAHFSQKTGIHRNTLQNLLSGKNVFAHSFQEVTEQLEVDPLELIVPQTKFGMKIPYVEELAPIVSKLIKMEKKLAVILIGSRAQKKAKKYSDWDLGVVRHPKPLSGREYLRLKGMVEEWSEDLVRTIDLVNLDQAPRWFLENLKEKIVFLDGNEEAFIYLKGVLDGIGKEKAA